MDQGRLGAGSFVFLGAVFGLAPSLSGAAFFPPAAAAGAFWRGEGGAWSIDDDCDGPALGERVFRKALKLYGTEMMRRRARALVEELGDDVRIAPFHAPRGGEEASGGRPAAGRRPAASGGTTRTASLDAWREAGESLADRHHELGVALRTEGKFEQAEAAHLKALAIDERLGRSDAAARDYASLAVVSMTQGELSKAVDMYRKALISAEAAGERGRLNKERLASVHAGLGGAYNTRGDRGLACEHWGKGRALFDQIAAATDRDRVADRMRAAACP